MKPLLARLEHPWVRIGNSAVHSMGSAPKKERFEGIELLRFALALGVVLFHFYFFGPHKNLIQYRAGPNAIVALMFGVEAFFAVSGFVIVLSAANRRPLDFLIARAARLGPTLLVASSLTLVLYFLLGVEPRVINAPLEYLRSILFFPLLRLGSGLDPSLWSLSFEIRFYLFVFLLMYVLDVRRNALRIAIVLLAFDLARTAVPALTGHPFPTRLDYFKDYTSFFVIGMLLQHRYMTQRTTALWIATLIAAVVMSAVRATLILSNMYDLSLHLGAIHWWQGAGIVLAILGLLLVSMRPVSQPGLMPVFRAAGRASYPLYVVHQLCGYWILNFCVLRLHLNVDLRAPVVILLVGIALAYGNWIEPGLIRLYKLVLVDATGTVAALVRFRPAIPHAARHVMRSPTERVRL
jgi:peptidoglycan/LPS O-acetylase OafA/YrhL